MAATIPAGKPRKQYLQHIYPSVCGDHNQQPMNFTEHWRLRLQELLTSTGLTQAAFAERIGVSPDYVSRLLYPADKAGRKNLGVVTMRKITTAFELPAGWFDAPLGTSAPNSDSASRAGAAKPEGTTSKHLVTEQEPEERSKKSEPVDWPFTIVTYQRIKRLRQHFSGRGMPPAISDIDKHLDVLVTRWENEMNKQKSAAA